MGASAGMKRRIAPEPPTSAFETILEQQKGGKASGIILRKKPRQVDPAFQAVKEQGLCQRGPHARKDPGQHHQVGELNAALPPWAVEQKVRSGQASTPCLAQGQTSPQVGLQGWSQAPHSLLAARSPLSWQHGAQPCLQETLEKRTVGAPPEGPFQRAGTGSPGQREVEPGILGEPGSGGGHGPMTRGYQTRITHPPSPHPVPPEILPKSTSGPMGLPSQGQSWSSPNISFESG